jgi:cell division protein FtsZ
MKKSGVALMGSGVAEGENRAYKAIEMAINSPLLNDNNIRGAQNILLYFASGSAEVTMDEIAEITDYIVNEAGIDVDIIWGAGKEDSLGEKLSITLVATGFDKSRELEMESNKFTRKTIIPLESPVENKPIIKPVENKVSNDQLNEITFVDKSIDIVDNNSTSFKVENTITTSSTQYLEPTYNQQETAKEENVLEESPYVFIKPTETPKVVQNLNDNLFTESQISEEDIDRKLQERKARLRDLSMKIKTPEGLSEIENQPAYVRRNVPLADIPSSSESEISRYTLSDNGDKKVEIRSNNSFLHDNVD